MKMPKKRIKLFLGMILNNYKNKKLHFPKG